MKTYLELTEKAYTFGSFWRKELKGLNIYQQFFYKDIQIDVSSPQKVYHDLMAEQMWETGLLSEEILRRYQKEFAGQIGEMERFENCCNENIYHLIETLRKQYIPKEAYQKRRQMLEAEGISLYQKEESVLNQEDMLEKLCKEKQTAFLAAGDVRWKKEVLRDCEKLLKAGKQVVLIGKTQKQGLEVSIEEWKQSGLDKSGNLIFAEECSEGYGLDFSKIFVEEENFCLNREKSFLIGYGEEALFSAKNLEIPAVIKAVAQDIYAVSITGIFTVPSYICVYVPKRFSIYPFVPIRETSKLTYAKLADLYCGFGEKIYDLSYLELRNHYPGFFVNPYGKGELLEDCGRMEEGASFYEWKDKMLKAYFDEYEDVHIISKYFDKDLQEMAEIPWENKAAQNGVLVNGIWTAKAKGAEIIFQNPYEIKNPRQILESKKIENVLKVVTNFLFFTTPKVMEQYNRLRKERPKEQLPIESSHLDYKLYWKDGKRVETFPLYKKCCMGFKENGTFDFFEFELGAGAVFLNGEKFSWEKEAVNAEGSFPVKVFTPYLSLKEDCEEKYKYKRPVGEGRLNLVIVNEKIVCIRRGEVLLPSIGVVISLDGEKADLLIQKLSAKEMEGGYYEYSEPDFRVVLKAPETISDEEWIKFRWIYGGGMSLIRNGENTVEECIKQEGWLSPLSMQTQESPIHKMQRAPRTAFGITEKGDFFVLVFSGRTEMSRGADYKEMCRMAQKIFGEIQFLLNADGGASSVLGAVMDGRFLELSYPAPTNQTPAGMIRNLNAMFVMDFDKKSRKR